MVPSREWLYLLTDKDYRSISVVNGAIVKDAQPTFLPQSPSGWGDVEIGFGTNEKYFSLLRSFGAPLKFINDGAKIIRFYDYKGKGYEEELYIMIMRWNPNVGIYQLEYRGRINMGMNSDAPTGGGLTANSVEGGVLNYLTANDGITYKVLCDETNPAAIKVLYDGIRLYDKFNYSIYNVDITGGDKEEVFAFPLVFESNEGDNVGIQKGDQTYDTIFSGTGADPSYWDYYAANSGNYPFSTSNELSVKVKTTVTYTSKNEFGFQAVFFAFVTSGGNKYYINSGGAGGNIVPSNTSLAMPVDITINLAPGEKLFLLGLGQYLSTIGGPIQFSVIQSDLSIEFNSIGAPTTAFALRPLDLLKAIVGLMTEGKYTADSLFFASKNNVVATCGDAIRNVDRAVVPNYYIQTSFADFYQSYNPYYNVAVKVVNNVVWIEPKGDIYEDDNSVIMDIGEIIDLELTHSTQFLINSIKTGFTVQKYDQRAGKYEFNATSEWRLPVTTIQKELNLVSKYRGDCFGIEFIRANLTKKDTTDDSGDKEVFVTVISDVNSFIAGLVANAADKTYTFTDAAALAKWFIVGDIFEITSGTSINLGQKEVVSVVLDGTTLTVTIQESVFDETIAAGVFLFKHYELLRVPYDQMTGVLDNTVFNVEISPARQLRAHGNYWKSLLYQFGAENVYFQKSDKNDQLTTTLGTEYIAENGNLPTGSMAPALFLPRMGSFKTLIPFYFNTILQYFGKGHVKATCNGFPIYFLPIGDFKSKPATKEAQEWKLLLSPKTSLDTLLKLSTDGIFITDYMENTLFIHDLNPLMFVKYDYTPPAGTHDKDIYDDWFKNRIGRYTESADYQQKFQTSDSINLQFISAGLDPVEIHVYNEDAEQVEVITADIEVNPAVQLPYILQQVSIDLTAYEEGCYLFTIFANGVPMAISEWVKVAEDFPETFLFQYFDTQSKLNAYFNSWRPMIRIEAFWKTWRDDSTFTDYRDENGNGEMLNGRPNRKRTLYIGDGHGVPEYIQLKFGEIMLLNRTSIEGTRYKRISDGKIEEVELAEGLPLNYYTLEVMRSTNQTGLTISDTDVPVPERAAVYTLDAQAFGQAPGVINVEVNEE